MQTRLHPCGSGKGKPLPLSIVDRIRLAVERLGWTPVVCRIGRDHLHVVYAMRTFPGITPRHERVCWYYNASDHGLHQGRYTVLGQSHMAEGAMKAWFRRGREMGGETHHF